jgi:hypothetical protein
MGWFTNRMTREGDDGAQRWRPHNFIPACESASRRVRVYFVVWYEPSLQVPTNRQHLSLVVPTSFNHLALEVPRSKTPHMQDHFRRFKPFITPRVLVLDRAAEMKPSLDCGQEVRLLTTLNTMLSCPVVDIASQKLKEFQGSLYPPMLGEIRLVLPYFPALPDVRKCLARPA